MRKENVTCMCKMWYEEDDNGNECIGGPLNEFLLGMSEDAGEQMYHRILHLCNWTDKEIAESQKKHANCFAFSWKELDDCLVMLSLYGLSYGSKHQAGPIKFDSLPELELQLAIRGV